MARLKRFRSSRTESKRQARVAQVVATELASIIRNGHNVRGGESLDDKVRQMISIVEVNMSPDLRNAKVFISVFGDRLDKREAYNWCVKHGKSIRHALSQNLKDMKGVPELRFVQTDVGAAVDVMNLIDEVTRGPYTRGGAEELDFSDEAAIQGFEEMLLLDDEEDEDDDVGFDDEEEEDYSTQEYDDGKWI
ncbi:unnamed protein product [Chrysoparadoxa australica]